MIAVLAFSKFPQIEYLKRVTETQTIMITSVFNEGNMDWGHKQEMLGLLFTWLLNVIADYP